MLALHDFESIKEVPRELIKEREHAAHQCKLEDPFQTSTFAQSENFRYTEFATEKGEAKADEKTVAETFYEFSEDLFEGRSFYWGLIVFFHFYSNIFAIRLEI